jgi:hypothetical protein
MRPLPLPIGMLGCGLMVVLVMALWRSGRVDGRLHLIVPQLAGDGILLVTPDGQTALIDGGTDGAAVTNWLGQELPFARRRLDLLVLTRADRTTLPGQVAAVRRYAIGKALLARPLEADPLWDELVQQLGAQDVPIHYPEPGDRVGLGANAAHAEVTFRVLGKTEERLTLSVDTGMDKVLLLQSLGDEISVVGATRATVLFYPWRRTTFDPRIQALAPQVVVFGDLPGIDPQRSFAERQIGSARLLHEAVDGRIELMLDEQGIRVITQQREH